MPEPMHGFGGSERCLLVRRAMNAIELLKMQHKQAKEALEKFSEGEIDQEEVQLFADELVAHMVIEEHVFYPRIKELKKDLVSESYEEHAVARFELARAMTAKGEEQKTRFTVLKELIEHHVKEEEEEMFPKVQKAISAMELDRLGEKMEDMFDKAVEAGLDKLVVASGIELASRPMPRKGNGARSQKNARGGRRPSSRPSAR